MDELQLLPRLAAAFVLGAVLGFERQRQRKPAGLRTHVLVATACALLMALSELLRDEFPNANWDPVRMAQGVLTGIGFIGAGTIIRHESDVTGLTTASTIWMAASLGLVAGAGFYVLAVAAAVLAMVALNLLGWLERHILQ